MTGERLCGQVIAVSAMIKLKFGDTIFVDLKLQDLTNVYILITGIGDRYIRIGARFILMKTAKKFRWKDSRVNENDSVNIDHSSYFMIDNLNQFEVDNNISSHFDDRIETSSQISVTSTVSLKAVSTLVKEIHCRQEQHIEGVVKNVFAKYGCIQLSMLQVDSDGKNIVTLCVYCPHGKLLTNLTNVRYGSRLRIYNVLPVYLWNELRGFACTVRSSVRLMTELPSSSSSAAASVSAAGVTPNKSSHKVSRDMKSSCVMFSVWKVETHRRLSKALDDCKTSTEVLDLLCGVIENLAFTEQVRTCNDTHVGHFGTQASSLDEPIRTNVQKRLALLSPQCIQDEFCHVTHAQLHQIRAGLDVDWLGDKLPEVWTCSRLRSAAVSSVRRHIDLAGVSQKQMFDTRMENLCPAISAERERLVVLVGAVRSVEMARGFRPGLSVHLGLVDGAGCAVRVVVRAVGQDFHKFLLDKVCGDKSDENSSYRADIQVRVIYTFELDHLSQFTFLLPRPTLCAVEEHPLHDEQSCVLSVLAAERDVVIVATCADKATGQISWRGADVDGVFSGPAVTGDGDVWRASDCLQVRDVLSLDTAGGAHKTCSVFGLVLSKQVILDDFSRASGHQYPHKAKRGSDRSSLRQKCKVTLRDARYPDTIVAYLSLSQATNLMVGMAVQMPACQLCLPESRKKPYLRTDGGGGSQQQGVQGVVHVLSFCDTETMKELCAQSSRAVGARRIIGERVSAPPTATIAYLSSVCQHNRCLWSLMGQVAFVRRILVTLRCTTCLTLATSTYGAYKCARCDSPASLVPLWEAVVALGDGSGEADLHVEGPNVHEVLRSRLDRDGRDWRKVVRLVEQTVRQVGKVVYDPFTARRISSSGGSNGDKGDALLEDFLWDEERESSVSSATNSADPSSILKGYLTGCSFATHFRVTCSVDFFAQQQQQQRGIGQQGGPIRRVNLQELNRDFPYRALFTAMPTSAGPRLCLEAYGLTELRKDETRFAAWDLLHKIEEMTT